MMEVRMKMASPDRVLQIIRKSKVGNSVVIRTFLILLKGCHTLVRFRNKKKTMRLG